MSIQIQENKCVGCKRCVEVCPGNLIKINENERAFIRHIQDCWGCTSCLKECPAKAIFFFLGADIGGGGGTFSVAESDGLDIWTFEDIQGRAVSIEINKKAANKY